MQLLKIRTRMNAAYREGLSSEPGIFTWFKDDIALVPNGTPSQIVAVFNKGY